MEIKKPDKKSLQYLAVVLVVAFLVGIGLFYYLSKTEIKVPEEKPAGKSMEEIIESLTAPKEGEPISEETKEGLSASSEEESSEVSEDILKNLTAPK